MGLQANFGSHNYKSKIVKSIRGGGGKRPFPLKMSMTN
jgi:hypothetical protein